jgi:hypothetical protein
LGDRYNLDPIVVRVAFVALTFFGGIGPLLYVLGWLFLPEEGDEVSGVEGLLHRGHTSMSPGFAVLLCLLLVPLTGVGFSSGWLGRGSWFGGSGLIALALFCVALYALHRNRGRDNRPSSVASSSATQTSAESDSVATHEFPAGFSVPEETVSSEAKTDVLSEPTSSTPTAPAETTVTAQAVTAQINPEHSSPEHSDPEQVGAEQVDTEQIPAPTWDPLAADPSAWDFPEPDAAVAAATDPYGVDPHAADRYTAEPGTAPRPKRTRSRSGLLTLGIALLVAGIGVAIGIERGGWFSIQHILGLVLGVLGLGMVVGAFVRGGRGLIWLAAPLAIIGVAITAVPHGNFSGGFGNIYSTPLTASEVQPLYQKSAGSIHLDLTRLPPGEVVTTEIRNGVGNSVVTVPETADVHFSCLTAAGQLRCLGRASNGVGNGVVTGEDFGPDGPGGTPITIKITNGAGNVEVRRG